MRNPDQQFSLHMWPCCNSLYNRVRIAIYVRLGPSNNPVKHVQRVTRHPVSLYRHDMIFLMLLQPYRWSWLWFNLDAYLWYMHLYLTFTDKLFFFIACRVMNRIRSWSIQYNSKLIFPKIVFRNYFCCFIETPIILNVLRDTEIMIS